jgi:adenylate cyclase
MMVIERNLGTRPLIDLLLDVVAQLYRYHSKLSFREDSVAAGTFAEVRAMTVGFVDLASSTEIGSSLSATDLARAINDFNRASFDLATRRGARIVKTIGDEVMFVALDASAVARAAIDLVEYFSRHEVFTAARAGVATGDVLEQDGDCYGPVVNRAARFVAAAPDGSVTADATTVGAIGTALTAVELDAVEHRGIGTVPWFRLSGAADARP